MLVRALIDSLCRSFLTAFRCLFPSPFYRPLTAERKQSPQTEERPAGKVIPCSREVPEPKAPNPVRVLLSGGPVWGELPSVWEVSSLRDEPKVKILCGNAYEHFEFSGSYSLHVGERLPVYKWCRRTYVAE
ncbi:DUF5988 family protein [Streptomyces sp. NPDC053086]|uniref:DUF5988 family protein n=1 Tax=unclassified Streptomyces TaxID=2593676 RepID=UPI0037D2659F